MRLIKDLPDPFLMNDGSRVKTHDDWYIHREEIKDLILNTEYGTIPAAPEQMDVKIVETAEEDGEIWYEKVRLSLIIDRSQPENSFDMDISVRYPFKEMIAEKSALNANFGENGLPVVIYIGNNPLFEMIEDGFIAITFENNLLEPMEIGNPVNGPIKKLYEKIDPGKYSWGSIGVWAWGAMRIVDYVYQNNRTNKEQIIITGHSRNGKAALLAGALDDRIAIVNPAGSGCAGAGSYLALGEACEDLASLTDRRRWWAWTKPDFEYYAYEERDESKYKLPFDQHFVMALVAPRPLLRTEGNADTWANPEGTCCTFLATEPIYEFLGVPERNQLFIRPGGHFQGSEDFQALLSLANWYFFGIPQERVFKDTVANNGLIFWTVLDTI